MCNICTTLWCHADQLGLAIKDQTFRKILTNMIGKRVTNLHCVMRVACITYKLQYHAQYLA